MAVRTREEILNSIKEHFGDDTSDSALALVEDLTDTITDFEQKANNDGQNWKQKYEDNDAAWRKKYRDRFFSGGNDDDDDEPEPLRNKNYSYENLFKEG